MEIKELIPDNKNDIFSSSISWFVTCVVVSILPFLLSYLFKSLSQQKLADIYPYLRDILLIVFPISCNIFFLSFDNSKKIDNKHKKISIISGSIFTILSFGYYIFLSGFLQDKEQKYFKDIIALIGSFIIIIICIIIGCSLHKNHDKNFEEDRQKINKEYKDLYLKFINTNQKKEEYEKLLKKIKDKYRAK